MPLAFWPNVFPEQAKSGSAVEKSRRDCLSVENRFTIYDWEEGKSHRDFLSVEKRVTGTFFFCRRLIPDGILSP
jgi:hypothetical protein